MQGADTETVKHVRSGQVPAEATDKVKRLFDFVHKLTLRPGELRRDDIDHLRDAGWTDEQIAECTYIAALFAFFNRVASAFGLEDPRYEEKLAKGDKDVPAARQQEVNLD